MKLLLTVDDFGLSKEINRSVIDLVKFKKINSVAIMSHRTSDFSQLDVLKEHSVMLAPHIVLNEEMGFDGKPLPKNYLSVFLNAFSKSKRLKIRSEIRKQLDHYFSKVGRADYLTSHQHVHLLPNLFGDFLEIAQEYKIFKIRFCTDSFALSKQGVLNISSAMGKALSTRTKTESTFSAIHPLGINFSGAMNQAHLNHCLNEARSLWVDSKKKNRPQDAPSLAAVEIIFHSGLQSVPHYSHWNFNWQEEHNLLMHQDLYEV